MLQRAQAISLTESAHCRSYLNPVGNWCGHDKENPRFFIPPAEHGRRPSVIHIAQKNLEKFYEKPKKWLNSLAYSRESWRQERTEARESDAAVMQVLLHYAELASLRVGVPAEDNGFQSLDLEYIADKAGVSLKRAARSIHHFKAAGYLETHKRFEEYKDDGGETKYKGLASVRRLTKKLFLELKVSMELLEKNRASARKRLKKKIQEYATRMCGELSQIKNCITNAKDLIKPSNYKERESYRIKKAEEAEISQRKADTAKVIELLKKHPGVASRELIERFMPNSVLLQTSKPPPS